MKSKKFIVGLFTILISAPLIFTSVNNLTGIKLDTTLQGNFDTVQKPDGGGVILPNQWFTGQYQSKFNNYFNNTFVPRATMLKTYNQLRYSLFDEGNDVVGKGGSIFGLNYLCDALILNDAYNFSLPANQVKMQDYVSQLNSIHHKLAAVGKQLIVYTTPSKAIFNADEIPQRYLNEKVDGKRAIDVFDEYIEDTDVVYFNSTEYLKQYTNEEWPIFYKTGIHWSRPAEQLVSQQIINIINELKNGNTKTLEVGELQVSNNAYWRDADVYNLQNIWRGKEDSQYYQFSMKQFVPQNYEYYTVLLQGGSFGEGLKKDYIDNCIGFQFKDIFYKTALRDTNWNATSFSEWSDLSLDQLLDQTDVVIIEINEAVLSNYSNGFVSYLNLFLDTYVPQEVEREYLQNLDCCQKTSYPEATVYGLYAIEDGFCWSDDYVMVQLENAKIGNKGIDIDFTIPQYFNEVSDESDTLMVYVNGELKNTVSLKQVGRQVITLSPNQITSDSNVYDIEFYCSKAFVPAELGINTDTRSLALQIHYIGEAR